MQPLKDQGQGGMEERRERRGRRVGRERGHVKSLETKKMK
jgi:hypothetical protein